MLCSGFAHACIAVASQLQNVQASAADCPTTTCLDSMSCDISCHIYVNGHVQVAPNIVSYTAAFTALDKGDDRGYQQLHVLEIDDNDELQNDEVSSSSNLDSIDPTSNSVSNSVSNCSNIDELSRGEVGLKLLATMQAEGHTPSLYCYSGSCNACTLC
jgi:hypothetical protein